MLIWRGWGLLAVVALFPLLASCAGLITVEPFWVFMLAASLSLLLGGGICVYCGTRWNRNGVEHSFYFVPLQAWGWVYLAIVGLFALAASGGAVKQGLDKPRWLYQSLAGVAGLAAAFAVGVSLRRLARPAAEASDAGRGHGIERAEAHQLPSLRQGAEPGAATNRPHD